MSSQETLVLMIDKRSPTRATMQKAEKKIQVSSLEFWLLFLLGHFCNWLKGSHENNSHTHNNFLIQWFHMKISFVWKDIIFNENW